DPDYVYEYAFNISDLQDKYGRTLDPATEPLVGFEVCIIDRDVGDAGRRFAVWKNTGENGYSWDNMDDCGEVAFSNEEISSTSTSVYKLQDGCAPVIDGTKDAIWEFADVNYINRHFRYENPSLNKATWQAVWNDTSIFLIVSVEDNNFSPSWISGDVDWMSDKLEIYFDVNNNLKDGGGPASTAGHYQIAPNFSDNTYQDNASFPMYSGQHGQLVAVAYAYKVNAPNYIFEYAVNIADLLGTDGISLDPHNIDMIGFDICIVDRDAGENIRKRAIWRNTGARDECWYNMDDCGRIKFSTNTVVEFPRPEIRLKGENILICLDSGRNSYNWYYENQLLTEELKQFYWITSGFSGNYYVATENQYGCKMKSNPFSFTAKSGTLKSSEPYIGIYPVPAKGDFMFEMADENSGRIILNIRDFSGQIIKSLLLEKDAEYISGKIDVHNISKGVYIIEIVYNNKAYFKRVLIN
ncbi:MAG: T9SS type A sorting domain-containing protein, partial [Bacteroidales bacterium]